MGHSPTKRMRMDIDAEEEEHTTTPAAGTGLSILPCRRHLRPQIYTITTTTTVILNATKGQAFMFPFQYIDWWCTEPDTKFVGTRESGKKPSSTFTFATVRVGTL